MYVSIRTKILGVLSVLLVTAIFAYLVLADRIFREDKQLLVFDTNRSNAERLASNLESSIHRIVDKTEMISKMQLLASSKNQRDMNEGFFIRDTELVLFDLVLMDGNQKKVLTEFVDRDHLAGLKLDPQDVRELASLDSLEGEPSGVLVENVSLPKAVLYLVRVPLELHAGKSTRHAFAQVVIDARQWLESFQNENLSFNFATTGSGRVLAYPETQTVLERKDMSGHELVKLARANDLQGQQLEFRSRGEEYLGVYHKTALGGLTVYSMMAKRAALSASLLLLEKTIVLSLIVVTLVVLIGLWFAGSLSRPLLELVKATREIAQGRFDTRIQIRSQDEIGTLAVAFDRMARDLKTSRMQLEDYSRSLEAKVRERTSELEQKNVAIREQQDTLLRTTRLAAVGEIAGQAAHEVLNPLTGMIARLEALAARVSEFRSPQGGGSIAMRMILDEWRKDVDKAGFEGWVQGLREPSRVVAGKNLGEEDLSNLTAVGEQLERFGAQLETDLGSLLAEAFRISRIVDGMRGLSRASSIKRRTDLQKLVTECVRANEDLLARHEIRIATSLKGDLIVDLDQDEMRQVLSNLLRNARDAIAERRHRSGSGTASTEGGRITISGISDRDHVFIRVRDNGLGIREADRERVFDPNFSTKGSEGTGFGLSICRRLVRGAGGDLRVSASEPGQFAEFEISLPRSGVESAAT